MPQNDFFDDYFLDWDEEDIPSDAKQVGCRASCNLGDAPGEKVCDVHGTVLASSSCLAECNGYKAEDFSAEFCAEGYRDSVLCNCPMPAEDEYVCSNKVELALGAVLTVVSLLMPAGGEEGGAGVSGRLGTLCREGKLSNARHERCLHPIPSLYVPVVCADLLQRCLWSREGAEVEVLKADLGGLSRVSASSGLVRRRFRVHCEVPRVFSSRCQRCELQIPQQLPVRSDLVAVL